MGKHKTLAALLRIGYDEELVKFCRGKIAKERLFGFLSAPWRFTNLFADALDRR